jgi:hypothetical protein
MSTHMTGGVRVRDGGRVVDLCPCKVIICVACMNTAVSFKCDMNNLPVVDFFFDDVKGEKSWAGVLLDLVEDERCD